MHIEPGVVNEVKMALSYATAAGATGLTIKSAIDTMRQSNIAALALRFIMATLLTVFFFEVLPKFPVGVSEVHFIFGSTLFLLFGAPPAAIGLAAGLAIQGLFLAPADLPQYFMNTSRSQQTDCLSISHSMTTSVHCRWDNYIDSVRQWKKC